MRIDHDILMLLVKNNSITLEEAKEILTYPLIAIPDPRLRTTDAGKLMPLGVVLNDPWHQFALDAHRKPIVDKLIAHPLSIYSAMTKTGFEVDGKLIEVIGHYYVKTVAEGLIKARATTFFIDTGKFVTAPFEEQNGEITTPNFDRKGRKYISYTAIKDLMSVWFDYISSLKLTPVLKHVKEIPVGKKAGDNLKLKSAPHASIIFLDRLPTRNESVKDVERVCTESTTKRGHQRIAYRKTLTADRYRNHPKYMVKDGVRVRTTWVGERTSSDLEGNTYTVMELK